MISSFELKNRPCCRAFYKIPYFIKNLVLLFLLLCVMVPTYLVHTKMGDLNVNTVYRMIAGLNSDTFDYLISRKDALRITNQIHQVNIQRAKPVDFYMSCVQVSRPCML
jgi:hypothetical protein